MEPEVPLVVLGADGHGKTTLANAIKARLLHGSEHSVLQLTGRGIVPSWQYRTERRCYRQTDCKGHEGTVRALVRWSWQRDAAILVVAADKGVTPATRQQVRVARWLGVEVAVVFLNKVDLLPDPDLLDLAEFETRMLLAEFEYRADDIPIVRGNALAALHSLGADPAADRCIDELLVALDTHVATPPDPADQPFLLPIEDVFHIRSRGALVTGRIERGRLRPGDTLEVVGLRPEPRQVVVMAVEMYGHAVPEASTGLSVGIVLPGIDRSELERGQVLAAPGSIKAHSRFEAVLYVLTREEGGRVSPFFSGYRPQFLCHGVDADCTIILPPDVEMCRQGDTAPVTVELLAPERPMALEMGQRFLLREGSRVIAYGTVTKLLA
jgi:elongation factor Tu